MRLTAVRLLIVLNIALALVLAWLWIARDGSVRNIHWQPPAAIKPDFAQLGREIPQAGGGDLSRFVSTLDRPLFSPSRRPPPPVVVTAPVVPEPDPLANIQLVGLFAGEGTGGILARIDGKIQRVRLNEAVGAWTLKSIKERDVTFARGDETRELRLLRVRPTPPPVAGAPAEAAAPGNRAAGAGLSQAQQAEDEGRERLRRRNEIRAKAGLPPLTQ